MLRTDIGLLFRDLVSRHSGPYSRCSGNRHGRDPSPSIQSDVTPPTPSASIDLKSSGSCAFSDQEKYLEGELHNFDFNIVGSIGSFRLHQHHIRRYSDSNGIPRRRHAMLATLEFDILEPPQDCTVPVDLGTAEPNGSVVVDTGVVGALGQDLVSDDLSSEESFSWAGDRFK